MKEREVESGYSWGYFVNDANTPKIYYTKMIHEQSIGNNLHFGLEDDTFKYLARACIRRTTTWCPQYHMLLWSLVIFTDIQLKVLEKFVMYITEHHIISIDISNVEIERVDLGKMKCIMFL